MTSGAPPRTISSPSIASRSPNELHAHWIVRAGFVSGPPVEPLAQDRQVAQSVQRSEVIAPLLPDDWIAGDRDARRGQRPTIRKNLPLVDRSDPGSRPAAAEGRIDAIRWSLRPNATVFIFVLSYVSTLYRSAECAPTCSRERSTS